MTNTKHTRGPWHLHANKSTPGFRIDSAGNEWQGLAEVYQAPGVEAEGEANAHLIAAAPKMYEALRETLDNWNNGNGLSSKVVEALAKAEGK